MEFRRFRAETALQTALARAPVVAILGARQCGKTPLAPGIEALPLREIRKLVL